MVSKKLAKQSKIVLSFLLTKSIPIKAYQIINDLDIDKRRVRYILKTLEEQQLVGKIPDLKDLRSNIYFIRLDNISAIKQLLNLF